jgi:hypothetical protein
VIKEFVQNGAKSAIMKNWVVLDIWRIHSDGTGSVFIIISAICKAYAGNPFIIHA